MKTYMCQVSRFKVSQTNVSLKLMIPIALGVLLFSGIGFAADFDLNYDPTFNITINFTNVTPAMTARGLWYNTSHLWVCGDLGGPRPGLNIFNLEGGFTGENYTVSNALIRCSDWTDNETFYAFTEPNFALILLVNKTTLLNTSDSIQVDDTLLVGADFNPRNGFWYAAGKTNNQTLVYDSSGNPIQNISVAAQCTNILDIDVFRDKFYIMCDIQILANHFTHIFRYDINGTFDNFSVNVSADSGCNDVREGMTINDDTNELYIFCDFFSVSSKVQRYTINVPIDFEGIFGFAELSTWLMIFLVVLPFVAIILKIAS